MIPVVSLVWHSTLKSEILALSEELTSGMSCDTLFVCRMEEAWEKIKVDQEQFVSSFDSFHQTLDTLSDPS